MYVLSRMGGLLGRLIATRLARLGHNVAVLGSDEAALRAWCPDVAVTPIPLAARHLEDRLGYAKGLILLPEGPDERHLQEDALVAAAAQARVPRAIRISMHGAARESPSGLLAMHGRADEALAASGIPHSILRPHLFMQDLLLFAPSIQRGHALRAPSPDPSIGFIDIRDVAECAVRLVQRPFHNGDIYTLTGARTWTLMEATGAIGEAIHRPVAVEHWPIDQYPQALEDIGLSEGRARSVANILLGYGPDAEATRTVSRITGLPPRALEMFILDHRVHYTGKPEKVAILRDREVIELDHALTW